MTRFARLREAAAANAVNSSLSETDTLALAEAARQELLDAAKNP